MPLPKKGGQYERSEFAGIPPSELWLKEKHEELKNLDPQKRRQISIYSELENTTKEQYERMNTVNKLQLYEKLNQNVYQKEENPEKMITLNSDNYLGTVNCIIQCLLKTLPLKRILRKFAMNQLQRNEYSKYEGVVLEQLSEFFLTYEQLKSKGSFSGVKVMRLLELMNPEFKSFYKRDPFEMLTFLISGLHDDLNKAQNRGSIQPINSYPAFENQGLVEFDYIQAERWDKFFKLRDDSPILDMFQGRILKHLQCLACYSPKLIFENFMSLNMNLRRRPKEQTLNLMELIVDYFQQYTKISTDSSAMSDEEGITQFYCLKCRKNTPYKKDLSIWKYPKFLIIQIQRFQSFVNKVNAFQQSVFFPVDSLDMRKFSGTSKDESVKKAVYNLYGVVSLAGGINANKFNSSVYNINEDKWYLYEDSEKVTQFGVESPSKFAYILFYQRVDALTYQYE